MASPSPRSIPACAGEASTSTLPPSRDAVYPRVCGGSVRTRGARTGDGGLSPRVRGKPTAGRPAASRDRSIPACAGEARGRAGARTLAWVYPRVCGGSGFPIQEAVEFRGLSPRVRGKLAGQQLDSGGGGSIPACAGEAAAAIGGVSGHRVYPRVCGGSRSSLRFAGVLSGLSPRVRGKPVGDHIGGGLRGSIPACAGEAISGSTGKEL